MASISIKESDFTVLAGAAETAKRLGDHHGARQLDVLARKANAALSNSRVQGLARGTGFHRGKGLTWRDVPTTLGTD